MFSHSRSAIAALVLLLLPIVADGQATRYGWPLPTALTRRADSGVPSRFLLSGPFAARAAAAGAAAQASPELGAQGPAFIGADAVPDIIVGSGRGMGLVRVLSGVDGSDLASGFPFGAGFTGGVRVASGDVDGDGVADVIMGQGLGGAQVRIFSGATATEIATFTAFVNFTGGVHVAAGDVNGDGRADLIVGAGAGGGVVRVFSGADRREIASGYPFGPDFAGGVTVATGDVNSDGQVDYVTGMALGGLVRAFDGATLAMLGAGFPYGPFYFAGIDVAAGDLTGDGRAEIITAAQLDIRPPVRVFDLVTGTMAASFSPHPDALGVRVAAGDLNADGFWDLVTGAGLGGSPLVRVFNGQTRAEMLRGLVFDPSFSGGVYVTTTASGGTNLRFTSPNAATFTAGTANTFTVTTAGAINPTIRLTAGTLPTGVTFTDNGNGTATLSGTPAAGTGGTYPLTFRSGFGVGIPQTFTLTVNEAPAITSANAAFMVANAAASFTVTTTGFPARTLSLSGLLPAGVTFVSNSNSTATLAGMPALGTAGVYPLIITATNGVGTDATQNFTLTVHNPPTVTSVNTATFTEGAANSFTVTTAAFPTATIISAAGALPNGVTLANNSDGTATLTGSPATGSAGAYPIVISASNGIGSPGTQNFTLQVIANPTPVFTSAAAATFTVNSPGSFTITTIAEPDVTSIVNVGALPAGITYTDNGNGTATLAGTPALGSDGAYALQFTADNGTATAMQTFTLTVNPVVGGAPVITSANGATFVIGSAGTFQVTTTGTPTATTIAATGALPAGVTLTNNGDGTATLAGTAEAGTAGVYPLVISATNANATATQDFTLTINNETSTPVFTSATSTTFTIGTEGAFSITTAANPDVTAITVIGTPPAGVVFTDNGNGTASLIGEPTAGAGLNTLSFSATNGIGAPVTQNFSLNVLQAAAVTSANSAPFFVGVAATFTITTVGTPTPSLTHTGTLPAGVNFTDNGDGTATLDGTAPIGTASPYPITITASNGVGVDGTQNFTLNVIGNNPPTLDPIGPLTIDEDAPQQTVNLAGISAGFNETQLLQVTAASDNTAVVPNPTATYTSPNATGSLAFTPVAGASGSATITVTVTDAGANGVIGGGDDGIVSQTFVVTVNAVPDPPTLDPIANANIPEDSVTQTVNLSGISAGFGETQDLEVTAVSDNPGLIPNPAVTYASPNATGSLDYTPAANGFGSAVITVTVTDAGFDLNLATAGDNGVFVRTFTVTVGAINDPPTAVADTGTTTEDAILGVPAPGLLANDVDIDAGDTRTVIAVNGSAGNVGVPFLLASGATLTVAGDGSYSYDPTAVAAFQLLLPGQMTTDAFDYTIQDGALVTSTAAVVITINGVNDGPVIDLDLDNDGGTPGVNYAVTFTENDPVTLIEDDIDATITDADHTDLTTLTVTLTNVQDGLLETLDVDLVSGGFDANFTKNFDTATPGMAILTIAAITPQPVSHFETLLRRVTYENTDEDPDTTPRVITFVANDGVGNGPAATTTVTIVAVNDPPVADNETYNVTGGGTLNIAAPGVLDGDTDPEGASLTAVLVTPPAFASSFTLNPDGSFSYTHNGMPTGDDSFTYMANDGGLDSNLATVTIDINGAPVAADDSGTTDEDTVLIVPAPGVLVNDTDPDVGDTQTVVAVNGVPGNVGVPIATPDGALVTLNADGSYIYNPGSVFQHLGGGQSDTDSFSYTVQDGGGLQASATATITINGVNDAPTMTTTGGVTPYTEDDPPVAIDGGVTIADVDDANIESATVIITGNLQSGEDVLTFLPQFGITALWNNVTGVLALSGSATKAQYETALRSVTYGNTSQAPNTAMRTITFQVNDGDVNSNAATKTVTVAAVNDAPTITAGATITFTEGNAATPIDTTIVVTDVDDTNLESATVQITGNYVNGEDVLAFTNQLGITGGFAPLTGLLTLTGTSTVANYQTALRSVTYFNGSNNPSQLARTVTWTVNDGTVNSTSPTSTINVVAVNDPPLIVPESFDVLGNTEFRVDLTVGTTPHTSETTAGVSAVEGVLDNDGDPEGDPFAITAVTGCTDPDGLVPFDCTLPDGAVLHIAANGEFSYTPAPGATGGTFTYTATDTPSQGLAASASGTVTFNFAVPAGEQAAMVWYVDADAAVNGNGTSRSPFNTLSSLGGADLDNEDDYLLVHDAAAALTAGITLEAGQRLRSEFVGLSIPLDLNGNGSPTNLVTASGPRPVIGAGGAVAVSVGNAIPREIVGFVLSGANAVDITTTAALTGSTALTIGNNEIAAAGAEGIDVNFGAGALTLNILTNSWNNAGAHVGNAVDIVRTAGTLHLNFSANTNVESNATAVNINGGALGGITVTGFADNSVHTDTAGSGIVMSTLSFDADPAAGGVQPVNAGTLAIGVDGDPVGAQGMSLTAVQGTLSFTDLDVYGGTSGLTVTPAAGGMIFSTTPVGSGGTSELKAGNGPAVDIGGPTSLNLQLSELVVTTTSTSGVSLNNVNGTFSAPGGSTITKTGAAGAAFNVSGSTAAVTYGGTITSSTGRAVSIVNHGGSTVAFNGAITNTNGTGIFLDNNDQAGAATINFAGGTTLNGASAAFTAINGGIVNVTGTNTIGATTAPAGPALNVANTTIGTSGLNFVEINATGGSNGIVLNNTGLSINGLTVAGTGGACTSAATCTGGAIQNTTGDGLVLTSTRDVALTRLFVGGAQNHGINATAVTDLALTASYVQNAGNGDNEHGMNLVNVTGTVTIDGTAFDNAAEDLVHLANNNTNATVNVTGGSQFSYPGVVSLTANSAILLLPGGTAAITAAIQNSTFTNVVSAAAQIGADQALSNGAQNFTFANNTINITLPARASGVVVSGQELTTTTIAINNNIFTGAGGNGVVSIDTNDTSRVEGTVSGNTIANPPGIGIFVAVDEAATNDIVVDNNTITNSGGDGIQAVNFGGVGVSTMQLAITNNQVNGHSADTGVSFVGGISFTNFEDTACLVLRGNTVTGTPASPTQCGGAPCVDYYLEEVGGIMTLEEVPNTGATTASAAYVNSINDAGPVTIFGIIDLTNGAVCNVALMAEGGEAPACAAAAAIDENVLASLTRAAVKRLGGLASLDADQSPLGLDIVDLPAAQLGGVIGRRVALDRNAAGWGWFVDPTPDLDEEFEPASPTGERRARPGGPADGRMDLLTALMHEMEHARGEAHADPAAHADSLMAKTLALGVRRGPPPGRPVTADPVEHLDFPAPAARMIADRMEAHPTPPVAAGHSPARRRHRSSVTRRRREWQNRS